MQRAFCARIVSIASHVANVKLVCIFFVRQRSKSLWTFCKQLFHGKKILIKPAAFNAKRYEYQLYKIILYSTIDEFSKYISVVLKNRRVIKIHITNTNETFNCMLSGNRRHKGLAIGSTLKYVQKWLESRIDRDRATEMCDSRLKPLRFLLLLFLSSTHSSRRALAAVMPFTAPRSSTWYVFSTTRQCHVHFWRTTPIIRPVYAPLLLLLYVNDV